MAPNNEDRVRGIIPAGVHPWGESCLDEIMPRVLLPVIGTPLIAHVIEWLRDGGVGSIIVCANSASPQVRTVLDDGAKLRVDLTYYDDMTPRGPAGCMRDAASLTDGDRFVVVEGTILPRFDLAAMLDSHRTAGAIATVAVGAEPGSGAGEQLVPVGVYVFERSAFDDIPLTGYQDAKEVLIPRLHRCGAKIRPFVVSEALPRITDASSYLATTERLLSQYVTEGGEPRGYRRRGQALVHSSASVSSQARLLGPMLIGPRTDIEDEAVLVGPLVLGNDCKVGLRATLCRTVVWNSCRFGPDAYLDNCIVTSGVSLEPASRYYGALLTPRARESTAAPSDPGASHHGGSSRIWDIATGQPVSGSPGERTAARTASRPKAPALG